MSKYNIGAMLKWLCERLMEAEVDAKINAAKSERTDERSGYRSGYRVRRYDTRLGTLYLFVPKLRKDGYIPFSSRRKNMPKWHSCRSFRKPI